MRLLFTTVPLLAAVVAAAVLHDSGSAEACAGLIGSNGAVNLGRTTTLAAYHDGLEHYVTASKFVGGAGQFGTLIPLPAAPTTVERAGAWPARRPVRDTHPRRRARARDAVPAALPARRAGLALAHSAPASPWLLNDLRSDAGMDWVPQSAWLTQVSIGSSVAVKGQLKVPAGGPL